MADEKKGITVKIDADLHAEIREYLERHEGMTMAEFITLRLCQFRRIHFSYNGYRTVFGVGIVVFELLTDMLGKMSRQKIAAHCFGLLIDDAEIFKPCFVTGEELIIGHILV